MLFLVLQEYFYTCNLVRCELRAWFVSREGKCEQACVSLACEVWLDLCGKAD